MSNTVSSSLISSVITATFSALDGPGSISLSGLLAGDIVVNGSVNGLSVWSSFASYFEPVVSVNGELQQTGGDLTGPTFVVYFIIPVL
jgi:hypothetical protein